MSSEGIKPMSDHSEDRLCRTIAAVLGVAVESLHEHASPDSIPSWDSVNHLNLVMALECEFEVSLSAEDAVQMQSVVAIRQLLRARGAEF